MKMPRACITLDLPLRNDKRERIVSAFGIAVGFLLVAFGNTRAVVHIHEVASARGISPRAAYFVAANNNAVFCVR